LKVQKYLIVLISLVFFTSCSIFTQPQKPKQIKKGDYTYFKNYMNWFIKEKMEEQNIVGLSVALVDDKKIVWQKGFGYANKEKGIKASKDTIYRAGSLTKTFNAMAVMKLAEENKMDIDKPLKTYLSQFSIKSRFGSTDTITPRNIMTHHSGIPSNWIDKMYTKNPISYKEHVELIKNEYVSYPVNTVFSYSNLAITLLGHAVENTVNIPYSQFIEKTFFNPMNMDSSFIGSELKGENSSKSYSNGKEVYDEYPMSQLPAGALNTSVSDLANFATMIHNNGTFNDKIILQKNSLQEMLKIQNKNISLDFDIKIGLGFFISDKTFNGKDRVYAHNGMMVNHQSSFKGTTKSKLSVIVMTNTKQANVDMIANEMLKQARIAKTGEILTEKIVRKKVNESIDFEGVYASSIGKIRIEKEDDRVFFTEVMGNNLQLKISDDNKFYAKYMLLNLIPINHDMLKDKAFYTKKIGEKTILVYVDKGLEYTFGVKIEPKNISQTWKNRLGTYYLINQPEVKDWQIEKVVAKIEDDFLILEVTMKSGEVIKYILEIVNDNEAILQGMGRYLGETIRVEEGILHYEGWQFKLTK